MKNQSAEAGQAVYSKLFLSIYDFLILGFSNSLIWKCPSTHMLQLFDTYASNNHLDVGVGTGYFLDHCNNFKQGARIGLMDMNPNSIEVAAHRVKRYQIEKYQQNILEPISRSIAPFDSISLNYLFHCLPGSMNEKAVALDHLLPILNQGGVVFGSTILQGSIPRSGTAKKVMEVYNKKGIFSNEQDTLEALEANLKKRFATYGIQVKGCVALFWAKK